MEIVKAWLEFSGYLAENPAALAALIIGGVATIAGYAWLKSR